MPSRLADAGRLCSQGSGNLLTFFETHIAPRLKSAASRKNHRIAIDHLTRTLGQPAAIADLTDGNLALVLETLGALGRAANTLQQVRQLLLGIAVAAVQAGALATLPACPAVYAPKRKTLQPWSVGELDQLLACARSMPGDVDGLPAAGWWTALLCVLLDTGSPLVPVMLAARGDYDRYTGKLRLGAMSYQLRPRTVAALDALRFHKHPRLIPWSLDGGKPPFYMLHRRYKELLFRAGLSYTAANLFQRLQKTTRTNPHVLDAIDWTAKFQPRAGKLLFARQRDFRRRGAVNERFARRKAIKATNPEKFARTQVYRLTVPGVLTLRQFFEQSYAPQRLADANADWLVEYRTVIERFSTFLACEATVHNLTDDTVERFLVWAKSTGLANSTINGDRAQLLALWRHAWRKRQVEELPRDVLRFKESKRLPEAWSATDVAQILTAAAAQPGQICGVPAGAWWRALLLTLYDTGIRIATALQLEVNDLSDDHWLSVPAEIQKQDAEQAFRLHPDTVAAIRATLIGQRQWLFPWPFDADGKAHTLRCHYRQILKRAGLPTGSRDLFHKLRRTSATAVCDAFDESAAQKHLGHSSLTVTRRYIDPRLVRNTTTAAEVIERPRLTEGRPS